MDEEIVGREVHVITYLNKKSDGFWSAKVVIKNRRTTDGEEWAEKSIIMEALDLNMDAALGSANSSIMSYLQTVNYDLFSEGEEDVEDNSPKN